MLPHSVSSLSKQHIAIIMNSKHKWCHLLAAFSNSNNNKNGIHKFDSETERKRWHVVQRAQKDQVHGVRGGRRAADTPDQTNT